MVMGQCFSEGHPYISMGAPDTVLCTDSTGILERRLVELNSKSFLRFLQAIPATPHHALQWSHHLDAKNGHDIKCC